MKALLDASSEDQDADGIREVESSWGTWLGAVAFW